jgi:hypothetical protein
MNLGDFDLIECALAVNLPDVYRRRLCPFPIPSLAGNSDCHVWDDARRLVALNQRLRAELEDWPAWLVAIGQAEGDPCGYAIDTRSPESPVWWLEQMRLGPASGPTQGQFGAWFSQWVAETSAEEPNGRPLLWFFVPWVLASVIGLIAYWLRAIYLSSRRRGRRR